MQFIKIKSSDIPNKPKPTQVLPDNLMYVWDPNANDWIILEKNTTKATPPLYDPNNQSNSLSNTTTQMYTPVKAANKEKTMQEYEDNGCDTTNLMKACQHIYYGFYDEIKNKWSPEKLLNYMEKRLDNAKNNPNEAKFEKNWATSRFPEAIELVKQFIEKCNGKKEVKSSANSYNIIMKAKKMSDKFYGNDDSKIDYMLIHKLNEDETDIIDTKVIKKKEAPTYPINPHEYFLFMDRDSGWVYDDYNMHPTSELKRYYGNDEQVKEWYKEFTKQSSLINSLNQFLDGDKYSREIKLEKGLISGGLIKLAGINPIRGPKYSITDKGLNLLKQAAQEEYDFEKDYIKARKSYLLDGISESEFQTGAPEEQGQMPKFSIFEKDGSELAQIEAKNSTDAKVKFFMENPEYEGSQSICIKEVKAELEFNGSFEYNNYKIDLFNDTDGGATFVIYAPKGKTVNNESMYKGTASTMDEAITKAYNIIDGKKEIDSAYGETTIQGLDFPNQSVSPSTDIKVDPKGWVNMAELEDDDFETKEYKKYREYIKDPMNRVKQLYNFIISDVDAYPRQIASICKHLATQKHKGLYTHEIAVKAWSSCVKEEYKKYRKNVDPNFTLPINYKPKVAERLCAYFDNEVEAYRKDMFDNKDETKIKSFLKLTAARITPKLLHLGQVLTPYLKNNSIELSTDSEDQDIIFVSGDAYLINKIEHEVRDTGLYCDTIDVTPGEEFENTFSLRIFLER